MLFITLLILSTLSIAGSAAFFSIYGLAQIFTGSFWPVVIMASSLEGGKLVAASFVYRYWKKIGWVMKSYLIGAILALMLITSAGIFGFLSAAYQQDILPLETLQTNIEQLDIRKTELAELKDELKERRRVLNKQVDDLPANYATKREIARKQIAPELEQINRDLERYNAKIREATDEQHELRTTVLQQEAHTGPIIFIAQAFDRDVDDATKWLIILIIFAFDPLAVMLTIGANLAILERKKLVLTDDLDEPDPSVVDIEQLNDGDPVTITRYFTEPAVEEPEEEKKVVEQTPVEESERPVKTVKDIVLPPNVPKEILDWSEERIRGALEKLRGMQSLTPNEASQKLILEEMLRAKVGQKGSTPSARMARLANPS